MSDANTLVQQAKKAYTGGDKAKAKELLLKAVDLDEHNEQAWMWMSAVVSSMEEQQICLENVLTINPNNEKARKGLDEITQKLSKKSAAPPAADPFAEYEDPFAGSPFATDPAPTPTWDAPASDSTTSVDWNRGGGSALGSGKNVAQPSADEYDDWMANLPITKPGGASTPAFDTSFDPSSGPFSAAPSPFDEAEDPFNNSLSR